MSLEGDRLPSLSLSRLSYSSGLKKHSMVPKKNGNGKLSPERIWSSFLSVHSRVDLLVSREISASLEERLAPRLPDSGIQVRMIM